MIRKRSGNGCAESGSHYVSLHGRLAPAGSWEGNRLKVVQFNGLNHDKFLQCGLPVVPCDVCLNNPEW